MNFYDSFVKYDERKSSENQLYAFCPFHNDKDASFTINRESDAWYCHGCAEGGHHVEFIMKYYDVSRTIAVKACNKFDHSGTWIFPTEEYVEKCAEALQRRPAALDELMSFGFTQEAIAKYQIGWDDIRVTFPIRSRTGEVINVRKYLPPSKRIEGSNNAKVIAIKDLNECRLYPYSVLREAGLDEPIYLVEGEKDCIALLSQGKWAMTGTSGTVLPYDELCMFKDRFVIIMTDMDSAGRRNEQQYLQKLRKQTNRIGLVRLPEKDFVDFWQKYKTTNFDDWYKVDDMIDPDSVTDNTAPVAMSLSQSEYTSNLGKWSILRNMCITGADPKTYVIPTELELKCTNYGCPHKCAISAASVAEVLKIGPREMAMFIDAPDTTQDSLVQRLVGCRHVSTVAAKQINVQKLLFQESAAFVEGLEDATFDNRYGLYMYHDNRLLPTVRYDFVAQRISDPRTQQNYYIIKEATAPRANVEGLEISQAAILFFRAVADKHDNIWDTINEHYSMWLPRLGIEGRADLFGALMLTYLSVTEIKWRLGTVKGWLDTMVIGDTRTGKSQMAQRIIANLGMGSYINGENARRTGVIGGVQRFGESWVITWGAIPLNDRGLLFIDEASGLSVEDIKELSATRSSGAVTINKIAKGEARARTRLIWMSNPRSGRNLDEFYWKGFGAFQEFIPVAEDQARYDIVITAARDDVVITFDDSVAEPDNMDTIIEYWKDIITFAWSVPLDNILVLDSAIIAVKDYVRELDSTISGGPLIVTAAVHEKLLRIACACALLKGRIFNGVVEVSSEEVDDAYIFFTKTIEKPTFDYKGYMLDLRRVNAAREDNINFIRTQIGLYPALRVLLASNQFRGQQMYDVLGIDRMESSKLLSELLKRGLVKITSSGAYSPDKLLIEITKQIGGN
jgi:hypothetical protein